MIAHSIFGSNMKYYYRFLMRKSEEDEYIQTYKVGKKKQDLDRLASKGIKKFSII